MLTQGDTQHPPCIPYATAINCYLNDFFLNSRLVGFVTIFEHERFNMAVNITTQVARYIMGANTDVFDVLAVTSTTAYY